MARLFLKELKMQLDLVCESITELMEKGHTDAFGTIIRQKDKEELRKLLTRKKELRKKIIEFNAE